MAGKRHEEPIEADVEEREVHPLPEDEDFAEDLMDRYANGDW